MQPGSSPLDQLADIHLPDGVSWWPLAPGWWILMGIVVLMMVALLLLRQRHSKRRYRQQAILLLQQAYTQYQSNQQSALYLQQLSELLRRVARTSYGTLFNPSIKGDTWLHWLDKSCPGLKHAFSAGPGQLLLTGPYQKNPPLELESLHQLSLEWIQKHSTSQSVRNLLQVAYGDKYTNNPVNDNGGRQHV